MTWQGDGTRDGEGPAAGDESGWPLPDPAPWPPSEAATPPLPPPPPSSPFAQPAPGPGTPPPGMPWAPPGTGYLGGVGSPALRYASTPARFVAWLVDGFIVGAINYALLFVLLTGAVGAAAVGVSGGFDTGLLGDTVGVWAIFLYGGVAAAISAAYFILQWSSGARATLGMRLFGLQLGNAADGRTLDRTQAGKRWLALSGWAALASIVPVVGGFAGLGLIVWELVLLVTVVNSPTKQGLHDQFAGSAMVQPAGRSDSGLAMGCVAILVILVVVSFLSIVALIFLGAQVSTILSTVGESV